MSQKSHAVQSLSSGMSMHCTIYVGLVVVVVTDTLISLHLFIQIGCYGHSNFFAFIHTNCIT